MQLSKDYIVTDYEELKSAILWRYDMNKETYRQRFRTSTGGRVVSRGGNTSDGLIKKVDKGLQYRRGCIQSRCWYYETGGIMGHKLKFSFYHLENKDNLLN